MTQLISTMGKENISHQHTEQAQERLKSLLNDYKNELLNFKLKENNLEPRSNKTQPISKSQQNTVKSKSTSKSPVKKGSTKKLVKNNESKSRSVSPVKQFEPEYGCMQCALNECAKHAPKTDFLEELLDNSSPYRKLHDSTHRFINEKKE
jgi:hypothetical protein